MRPMFRTFVASCLAASLALTAAPALACGDDHHAAGKPVPAGAQSLALQVAGMSCGGCANEIRNALLTLDGVYDAEVSFETGVATVRFDQAKVDQTKVSAAIVKAGFTVVGPAKG